MISMVKIEHEVFAVIFFFLLLSTASMRGQTLHSIDSLARVTSWIEKGHVKQLKAILQWQVIEAGYNLSAGQRDSLMVELRKNEKKKEDLSNRLEELKSSLSTIFPRNDKSPGSQVLLRCDTTILLLHQGLYGNQAVEDMQEALLVCRRAESVLSVRYDEDNVVKARETLQQANSFYPKDCADIDSRLEQYGSLVENLRNALIAADTLDRLNPTEELSSSSIERYTRRFFDKLGDNLNPVLLVPSSYPYLYGILTKAMAIIMNDPRKDITELIDKL